MNPRHENARPLKMITVESNIGVYKMERGKAFTVPHFALRVWAKPNEDIFQFIGIPRPIFIDFNDLQTVT